MTTNVIIVGHGNYSTGIESSIKLLAGHNEGVEFIDFLEEDTDVTLKDKINQVIAKSETAQTLFICDLLGGTPFKVCVEISYEKENMEVTAGCNIGAILEIILIKDTMEIEELADNIVKGTKDTAVRFLKVKPAEAADDADLSVEDGI